MLNSENLSLTFFKKLPLTPSLSRWGEGGGEGKFQIPLTRILKAVYSLLRKKSI